MRDITGRKLQSICCGVNFALAIIEDGNKRIVIS